jgi:hypothetical protein
MEAKSHPIMGSGSSNLQQGVDKKSEDFAAMGRCFLSNYDVIISRSPIMGITEEGKEWSARDANIPPEVGDKIDYVCTKNV